MRHRRRHLWRPVPSAGPPAPLTRWRHAQASPRRPPPAKLHRHHRSVAHRPAVPSRASPKPEGGRSNGRASLLPCGCRQGGASDGMESVWCDRPRGHRHRRCSRRRCSRLLLEQAVLSLSRPLLLHLAVFSSRRPLIHLPSRHQRGALSSRQRQLPSLGDLSGVHHQSVDS